MTATAQHGCDADVPGVRRPRHAHAEQIFLRFSDQMRIITLKASWFSVSVLRAMRVLRPEGHELGRHVAEPLIGGVSTR
jgi:hypothetical protein